MAARSRFIVNPKYLSAERSSVVCGRCHDRRQGYGGPTVGYTQAVSEAGALAGPGISRHELITKYTDPVKKGPTMRGPGREDNIWPDDVHSNKPHQQYSDFLKSKMHRNDRLLVTCSDCHDLHGGTPYQRWLIHDPEGLGFSAVPAMSQSGCPVAHGDEAERQDEGTADALHRLPYAGDGEYGRRGRQFRQDDQDASVRHRARRREQRILGGPVEVARLRRARKTNVAVHGVSPGRAMPIPYTAACGTCHAVSELPFK